jgi:hypothetical protein
MRSRKREVAGQTAQDRETQAIAGEARVSKGNPAYNALMDEVCVERGWCGSIVNGKLCHVDDFIPEAGPVSADQFVDWLFKADGVDADAHPEKWRKHQVGLRDAFVRHLGSEVVDASALKWNVD